MSRYVAIVVVGLWAAAGQVRGQSLEWPEAPLPAPAASADDDAAAGPVQRLAFAPEPTSVQPGGIDSIAEPARQFTLPAGEPTAAVMTAPAAPPAAKPAKPAASPYKGVFYDNDFRYLDDPKNTKHYFGDAWKRRHAGCVVVDVGGEFRLRQHNEHILTRDNNFFLDRTRVYADVKAGDLFRVYAEGIEANSSWEDLAPRAIEENHFDALNLFADAKLLETCEGKLWLRGGRQELLFGAQRLISPLDWANTRRTFDGTRLFWRGEDWDLDAFWTRPVPLAQHLGGDSEFDHPDPQQEFYGTYVSRKNLKNQKLEAYYLRLGKYDGQIPYNNHTFGGRWEGEHCNWLAEIEAAYQLGDYGDDDQRAGFYTIGGGRRFATAPWKPVFWVYYDWASGDRDPTDDVRGTFNQLFPLGHKYFGFMDIVGRQNIEDWNFLLVLAPSAKFELMAWYHIFQLQQERDALYDSGGAVLRQDPTGAAGSDVGSELDLTFRWIISPRTDLYLGYSHLFPGAFLLNTPGGAEGRDFYYTQFAVRF